MARILCIGDSNTYGHDPRSYGGDRYPHDVRWAGRLERAGREIVNAGRNGRCIPKEAELPDVEALLRRSMPLDAVVVMLGTNDLLRGAEPEEAAGRMEKLLSFIKYRLDAVRLLLVCPPPMERGSWVPTDELVSRSKALARLYRAAAEKAGAEFADADAWGVELIFDGVHFSPAGHAAFAEGLEKKLDEIPERQDPSLCSG